MRTGRPRGHQLDASVSSSARLFPTQIDGRWRIRIPGDALKGLSWLEPTSEGRDVLAAFKRPGVIALRPWDPDGVAVVNRHRELEELAKTDSSTYAAISELALTYNRFTIGVDGMITLSDEALFHMHLVGDDDRLAFVVRTPLGLEIWSRFGQNTAATNPHPLLKDLDN